MSIIISGIKLEIDQDDNIALTKALQQINGAGYDAKIFKKSIDARRGNISKIISVILSAENEKEIVSLDSSIKIKNIAKYPTITGDKTLQTRPIIIGFGPAGIYAALILAKNGYKPIIFERGEEIEKRDIAVDDFMKTGKFSAYSNVQFGEGGAGTYSDGKLTTRINDEKCEIVIKELLNHGAPSEISTLAKPHIGTDILKNVVISMREEIKKLGGEVLFAHKLENINIKNGEIKSIIVNGNEIPCEILILAIGHSARDTFEMLEKSKIYIEPKAFSVGARIEHLQSDIDKSMYGKFYGKYDLPPAEYSLANKTSDRACYSFCMCPGGIVVPASSEENTVLTNGMSYHARDMINANSAIAVNVNPKDFDGLSPLSGMYFQREIEKRAYNGDYNAPAQRIGDFLEDRQTKKFINVIPSYPIGTKMSKFSDILPSFVIKEMKNGLASFGNKINAFRDVNAVFTGPETRTSSPIRITRNEKFQSINTKGLIPCGEGAGYAGGIISAAVDGIKCAEKIMSEYKAVKND